MSWLAIPFGTRKGYGEPLDEDTPFSADFLCHQCHAVFDGNIDYIPDSKHVLHIDRDSPTACRLCALLASHFPCDENSADLRVQYWLELRFGFMYGNHDIVFYRMGPGSENKNSIRLGLQKWTRDENDHEPSRMVRFESNLSSSTDSLQSTEQIVSWLKACSENHESCKEALRGKSFVPTRLIEIVHHDDDSLGIRLRKRGDLPLGISYATLSHCWGPTMPFKLQSRSLGDCLENIPLDAISKVFQDAVKIAHRLGISYIWIDSLCIIQDSPQDWITESSRMGLVYQSGILNIAATGFTHGQNGMFVARDPSVLTPITLSLKDDVFVKLRDGERQKELDRGDYYLVDTSTWKREVDNAPLCKRGWVTQERALSVRTIHFGAQQLFWECMCENATEVYPNGLLSGTRIMNPKVFLASGQRAREQRIEELQGIRKHVLASAEHRERNRVMWKDYTEKYGYRHGLPGEEGDSDDGLSDKDLAKRMNALRVDGKSLANYSSESSDVDDPEIQLEMDWAKEQEEERSSRPSVRKLKLTPRQFEGCDPSILDNLNIKGWSKFKKLLKASGLGEQSASVSRAPIRGMKLELRQWVRIVEMFSGCSLTFSKDKLVAISGMAQTLHKAMGCDYLAGLWRTDLEHQLLWKVARPSLPPEQDGTRGPSWSWASVDGAFTIPDWSGYFSTNTPGKVTWLAQVDHASVHLGNTGPFGQVRSGTLVMTGCLGVLRINKALPQDVANANGTLIDEKHQFSISWDTQDIEATFGNSHQATRAQRYSTYGIHKSASTHLHPQDVFYLPVRIMDADPEGFDYEVPVLTGLLLLPTGSTKGHFRRVGQFELSGRWAGLPPEESKAVFTSLTKATGIGEAFYVNKRRRGEYTFQVV